MIVDYERSGGQDCWIKRTKFR